MNFQPLGIPNQDKMKHEAEYKTTEMEKAADAADTSVLFFSAGANF